MDETPHTPAYKNIPGQAFEIGLVILILTGLFFRFNWVNWNQDTNLHPDEYGLTNTLTQLEIPKTFSDYFNTRISPISPYDKYDFAGNKTASGPDNRMRWGQLPITIIRMAGEMSGNTGYGEIRLLGRKLSALADALSLLLIFLIGLKLYGRRVALLATALSALAVMQIQQSHFMTVDNFGGFFTTLALFACVQIASKPPVTRQDGQPSPYQFSANIWGWYLLFGAAFGMALACKINLLPVGGLVLVAAFIGIADLKLKSQSDLQRILLVSLTLLALAFASAAIVFRICQPISFRAASGNTSFFNLNPNPDWVESMKVASAESSGEGGGPPSEQWAHRLPIVFPLVNMVLWGMGLPLGLAAWLGFGGALWQLLRTGKNWRAHLLPLVWAGGYFLFMGTRWVKSVRYFLPIYPFLCLLAAWGLMELWNWATRPENPRTRPVRMLLSSSLIALTVLGTLAWANAFVQAVYETPHTRIQATTWIFQNIPGPFQLGLQKSDGSTFQDPLGAPDNLMVSAANPVVIPFVLSVNATLNHLTLPHVQSAQPGQLLLAISNDPAGNNQLSQTHINITASNAPVSADLTPVDIQAGSTYYLTASSASEEPIIISRTVIANESWDESLPMPFDGYDPYGQLYRGETMEVRWPDDAHKREVLLAALADADYLILPSQRAIWSTCRIPLTYPMTMEYYRALFDGRLGFEEAASFSAPFKLGGLEISDVGGTVAWNKNPVLPLFNSSIFAAEEAFSVYDHPPVWIFKKTAAFSLEKATSILSSVDLSQVVVQSARDAGGNWCPAK